MTVYKFKAYLHGYFGLCIAYASKSDRWCVFQVYESRANGDAYMIHSERWDREANAAQAMNNWESRNPGMVIMGEDYIGEDRAELEEGDFAVTPFPVGSENEADFFEGRFFVKMRN
jgi:hypothetical protein